MTYLLTSLVIEMLSDSEGEWLSMSKTTVGFVWGVNLSVFNFYFPLNVFNHLDLKITVVGLIPECDFTESWSLF